MGALFLLGLVIFGSTQIFEDSQSSRANHFPLPFSDTGNADWCSSSLQANLNTSLFTDNLGSSFGFLTTQDCGDIVSLISETDWQAYKEIYQTTLGTPDYLPAGVTNSWTTTGVGDPEGKQVYQIDPAGALNPADSDSLADFIPAVKLASTTACVTGSGTTSDPYVLADDSLCVSTPIPTITPIPSTTPTSVPTPTPTSNSTTTTCNLTACKNCSSANYCSECEAGYSLSGGRCIPDCGVANCASCSSPNFCSACLPGFVSVSGQCQAVSPRPSYPPNAPTTTPAATHTPIPASPTPIQQAVTATTANPNPHAASALLAGLGGHVNPFGDLAPDLYSLLVLSGVSRTVLSGVQYAAAYILLPLLLIALIPIALLLAFYPLPKGKVFDLAHRGVPGTLITATKEGQFIGGRMSDATGRYHSFRLPAGEYEIYASKPGLILTSPIQVRPSASPYRKAVYPNFFDATDHIPTAEFSLTTIVNFLAAIAPVGFAMTVFVCLFYLTPIAIFSLLSYLPGLIRRAWLSETHPNLTATLKINDQPLADTFVDITTMNNQLAATAITDGLGNIQLLLSPNQQYQVSPRGSDLPVKMVKATATHTPITLDW